MGTGELNASGNPAMDYLIQGIVEIFLVASCYRNRDKLRPIEPLGSVYVDYISCFGKRFSKLF